jgi:cell wall-associated NlpC family hydrolase
MAIPFYGAGKYDGSVHGPATGSWIIWTGATTVGHDGNVAQAGDLAVWQTHMGICTGPNQMVSAQNPGSGTQVSSINGFINEFLFIRRLHAVTLPGSQKPPPGGGIFPTPSGKPPPLI